VTGVELYVVACDVFEAAGHPTGRTKPPGETLREGFYFGLEPGTVVPGVGGRRVEDLLIVTADGSERSTGTFPYGLAP
jgi:Xaa-Pro aminopeptidase